MSSITTDTYIVAAVDDHIVPWKSSYKSTQLFKGPIRFVLTSSGHIAGIVNPPSPKSRLWTNDDLPSDPDLWLASATEQRESWWEDWVRWIGDRAGARGAPPAMGSAMYPPLGDAPGHLCQKLREKPIFGTCVSAPHMIRTSVCGVDGRPLVLVNGLGAGIETWKHLRAALGDAVDDRGRRSWNGWIEHPMVAPDHPRARPNRS